MSQSGILPITPQKPLMQPVSDGMSFFTTDKANYFTLIFYLLLTSMQTRQHTVMIQSKDMVLNADKQDHLNKLMGHVDFVILPDHAGTSTIDRVQQEDQEFAAIRDDIQNDLITARQNAQVEMTQTTTNVNILEQDASENSGWLKTLNTIFQVIDGMSKNS